VDLGDAIEGITVSGGEPLQQCQPLIAWLRRLRHETGLSTLLFTGYSWEEIQQMPDKQEVLAYLDVLIAGRYDASRHLAHDLRGSANKTMYFLTDRYQLGNLRSVHSAEVVIAADGTVILSGIDPLKW
jgi:anaerobic ribonucleoside-triphosphate reductase activating protein